MRFGVSRSPEPDPVRSPKKKTRTRFTFGLSSLSSSDEEDPEDLSDGASSSSDADFRIFEPMQSSVRNNKIKRSVQEQREIDDTLQSFRRRAEYQEPFREWQRETHAAAFETVTKKYASNPASIAAMRRREIALCDARLKESYDRQLEEVTAILEEMSTVRNQEEARLISDYKERERLLWQRVEGVIKNEEDKTRRRIEAEEKVKREEEERKRREEERKKAEEEKKKKEEAEKALREELLRKKKQKEEEDAKKQAEEDARRKAEMDKMDEERRAAGFTTAQEDWDTARQTLMRVKEGYLKTVKGDSSLRSVWSRGRRSIVPKIGQLTNSQSEIDRITSAILQVFNVQPPHPEPIYFSLISGLAKAILMQAETEVSARAVTAIPLSKVTINLLMGLQYFSDVLWARIVQRTGGWVIPFPVRKPENMSEVEYKKLRGYRTEREGQKDFENRVIGIMKLYFAILIQDVSQPMGPLWALPRYWTYITRLMSTPLLLRSDMAMQILAAALEVGGFRAMQEWGSQFLKILEFLYNSIQSTSDAPPESRAVDPNEVGASGPEGRAGRVRLVLEIEKVLSG